MIDKDLIESLDVMTRYEVRAAIAGLASSGVLKLQRERLLAQLANGSESEPEDQVAKRVILFRKQDHALLSLQQLGESIMKEQTDDNQ